MASSSGKWSASASADGRGSRLPSLAKYRIVEEIGHGGMATVYRATDPRLQRDVAIKVIHPHLRDSSEVAHRFHVEAQAVAKLRHPNIVEVFDVSAEDDREQYLVVELVRGKTLRKILQDYAPIPPEIAAAIALQLLSALDHAHTEGVIHRDVKPENVLIAETPNAVRIKLTDFGIAKLLDAQGVTSTGQVLGSPAHMAPEQIEGGEVGARSDVFGMGVLLYECMVGHLPFEGQNPAQVLRRVLDGEYPAADMERPVVGKMWSSILDRALAREASQRYASAAEMREAIAAELTRLAMVDPAQEIASFLAHGDEFERTHNRHLIDRLCALGAASRHHGDAIVAAADYNRALAYAPDDPALVKVVSTMHRQSARLAFVRRALPLALAVGLATAFTFFGRRIVHDRTHRGQRSPTSVSSSILSTTPSTAHFVDASATAPPLPLALTLPSNRVAPVPAPVPLFQRKITFVNVKPMAGVTVSIDDGSPTNVSTGTSLAIDARSHVLTFGCVIKDVCDSVTRTIGEGKTDEPLSIEVKVKPAILVVVGDSSAYGLDDFPSIDVKSGVPVSVPVRGYTGNWVTVIDRNDPTRGKKVNLTAGRESRITFSEP